MKSFQGIFVILFLTVFFMSGMVNPCLASADDSTVDIEKRLNDLEEQVADLKQELWKKKQASPTNITANAKDGFSIRSEDGNYSLKIGGYAQAVAREFADNKKGDLGYASSIIPRRVRLMIQGTVAHDFDFYIQPEFGFTNTYSSITATAPTAYAVGLQDAWIRLEIFSMGYDQGR